MPELPNRRMQLLRELLMMDRTGRRTLTDRSPRRTPGVRRARPDFSLVMLGGLLNSTESSPQPVRSDPFMRRDASMRMCRSSRFDQEAFVSATTHCS
jgi:hypothetical protein